MFQVHVMTLRNHYESFTTSSESSTATATAEIEGL